MKLLPQLNLGKGLVWPGHELWQGVVPPLLNASWCQWVFSGCSRLRGSDSRFSSLCAGTAPVRHRAPAGQKAGLFPAAVAAWLGRILGPQGCPSTVPRGLCTAVHSLSDGRTASAESIFFSFVLRRSIPSFIRQGCGAELREMGAACLLGAGS